MFDCFVSLGWFCGTASSMSRYGLRKMSSPFDWCLSELYGVMHFLDTDFADFMSEENIQVVPDKPKEIKDIKWGIYFNHDVKEEYEIERNKILEKYTRRIQKLREEIANGVICFIRTVRDQDEIKWIMSNAQYIEKTITRGNKCNKVIFLIPHYFFIPNEFPFDKYILQLNVYDGGFRTALRDVFDTVPEFVEYCTENYSSAELAQNKIFDLEKELRFWQNRAAFSTERNAVKQKDETYKMMRIVEGRFQRLLSVAKYDYSNRSYPKSIIIYGAGDIGKLFCDSIRTHTKVECFIDKDPSEKQYEGINIYKPDDYFPPKDSVVIVIPTYDFCEIKKQLSNIWNVEIIGIEDFLMN